MEMKKKKEHLWKVPTFKKRVSLLKIKHIAKNLPQDVLAQMARQKAQD